MKLISCVIIFLIPIFLTAQDLKLNSTYDVIKKTQTTNGITIQSGAQVRALGVIDVPVALIPSGKQSNSSIKTRY